MNTPNIDNLIFEVTSLRNSEESLRVEAMGLKRQLEAKAEALDYHKAANDKLRKELAQKQESWDKAANYWDKAIKLQAENDELVRRINERYYDASYHVNALDRLASFVKPEDMTSEGVVTAAIDRITHLTEERDRLQRWQDEAMLVDYEIDRIDRYVRSHAEATIGDSVWHLVSKWLIERDHLKRQLSDIQKILL